MPATVAALSSTQPAPFNALGKLAELRGDTAAAKKFFKEALDRNPQHAPSLHSLGVLLSRQRLFAQAEAYFRRASEASPHDPKIWQAWALMEWRCRGRYGEAKELFERGIEKCPPHAPLYVAFASCEASRRGRTKARALLRQVGSTQGHFLASFLLERKKGENVTHTHMCIPLVNLVKP